MESGIENVYIFKENHNVSIAWIETTWFSLKIPIHNIESQISPDNQKGFTHGQIRTVNKNKNKSSLVGNRRLVIINLREQNGYLLESGRAFIRFNLITYIIFITVRTKLHSETKFQMCGVVRAVFVELPPYRL